MSGRITRRYLLSPAANDRRRASRHKLSDSQSETVSLISPFCPDLEYNTTKLYEWGKHIMRYKITCFTWGRKKSDRAHIIMWLSVNIYIRLWQYFLTEISVLITCTSLIFVIQLRIWWQSQTRSGDVTCVSVVLTGLYILLQSSHYQC